MEQEVTNEAIKLELECLLGYVIKGDPTPIVYSIASSDVSRRSMLSDLEGSKNVVINNTSSALRQITPECPSFEQWFNTGTLV